MVKTFENSGKSVEKCEKYHRWHTLYKHNRSVHSVWTQCPNTMDTVSQALGTIWRRCKWLIYLQFTMFLQPEGDR